MWRRQLILANKLLLWVALAVFGLVPAHAQTLSFPPLTGRVVDGANVLTPEQASALADKLKTLETTTGHQLVVATIADLQGDDIADYGYKLGRNWQVGSKATNDGAIIIVAPHEHKVRIEVGYGLEPIVTDALSEVIISQQLVPAFKSGDYVGGLNKGVDALGDIIKLPPDEASARAKALVAASSQNRQQAVNAGGWLRALPWIFFAFFVIGPMLFRRRGAGAGYGGGGLSNVLLWSALNSIGSGRDYGGGGSFGGGGDSGGFSGGGGSFGGGGSSGSW